MWNLKNEASRCIYKKEKQTHRYREQTSGYQWGEESREEQDRDMGLRGSNNYV